jgi:hypothetical protein
MTAVFFFVVALGLWMIWTGMSAGNAWLRALLVSIGLVSAGGVLALTGFAMWCKLVFSEH